jgi:transcriptional regulator of arginine metabolism|tara:strand:- start:52875 stop:53327 length:453 start_codon:yes stop_codon:yes gene_type:complete
MPTPLSEQLDRRNAIAAIIKENNVVRQKEIVTLLQNRGYGVTQSSVSRDLKEMGINKLNSSYVMPDNETNIKNFTLKNIGFFITEVISAGPNLLVLKTETGAAQTVAVTLDENNWPEIVATLSGDDTIFIATQNISQQNKIKIKLNKDFA